MTLSYKPESSWEETFWKDISPSKKTVLVKHSFLKSIIFSFETLISHSTMTFFHIIQIFRGKISLKKSVTGPVGIVRITNQEVKKGLIPLLRFMAFLSIALGFFNLLPIPLLDGGHVFFYIIEWIFKKPLKPLLQNIFQAAGIILLLSLTLFVFYNDLSQLNIFRRIKGYFVKNPVKKEVSNIIKGKNL